MLRRKRGSVLLLLGERGLEAVAGLAFVQRQRRDIVERPARQIVGVHQAALEPAAARRVEGRERVRHRDDREAPPRQ